jgi:hypothetical protein
VRRYGSWRSITWLSARWRFTAEITARNEAVVMLS